MMAAFHWVTRAFVLLLLSLFSTALDFNPCCLYDYEDYNVYPPYDTIFNSPLADVSNTINVTLPVIPPLPLPPPPPGENCTTIDPGNGTTTGGNSLFLVVDPKTLQIVLQVATPCNKTDNGTKPTTGGAGGLGEAGGAGGLNDLNSSSGLVCNLLTLIQKLVDSILQAVLSLLKSLIDIITGLLSSILQEVLAKLLPTLVDNIGSLLAGLLTDIIDGVEKFVNTTLTGILGKEALVTNLLQGVDNLLGAQLLGMEKVALNNITQQVGALLNNTIIGVLDEVEALVNSLLAPTPSGLVPSLTTEITTLVNNTLQDLLKDVDVLVTDLLTKLLSNSSVLGNLTEDVTKLLNDFLGDTICNVEKLLNDSDSLSKLILNLEKLIQDLLDDILEDVDKLVTDALTSVLSKQGLLDKLIQDILKCLQDLLTNLAFGSRVNGTKMGADPNAFIGSILTNLTDQLTSLLNNAVPGGSLSNAAVPDALPGAPPLPGAPVDGLLPAILGLVNNTLTEVLTAVQTLLTGLDTTLADANTGLISNLIKVIEDLLDNLLKNLLGGISESFGGKMSNTSNVLDPSSLTGSLGTLVTNILKQVLLCNGTCNNINNTNTNTSTNTNVTPCTIPISLPYFPILPYYPRRCLEDTLFNNANDPATFLLRLQQYQAYINRNIYGSIPDCGEDSVDALLSAGVDSLGTNRNLYPSSSGFESLPCRLLGGLEGATRLTSNVATSGLLNLVNSVMNSTTS